MKKAILLFVFTVLINTLMMSQQVEWAKQIGGADDNQGNSIALDANGNSIVPEHFWVQ